MLYFPVFSPLCFQFKPYQAVDAQRIHIDET